MLFPGDAAIMAHTQADLQAQMDKFASACSSFGLAENVEDEPDIFVDSQKLMLPWLKTKSVCIGMCVCVYALLCMCVYVHVCNQECGCAQTALMTRRVRIFFYQNQNGSEGASLPG